jgi:hypothetical protein
MKKVFLICLFLAGLTVAGAAQSPSAFNAAVAAKTLKEQAFKAGQAFLKKDYKTFAHYTYPKLITMSGGEDKMIQALQQTMDQIKAQGVEVTNFTYEEPGKAFKAGNSWQSTIVQHTKLKTNNGGLMTTSTLIAFSSDNGKDWTFIDTSNKDMAAIHKMLPELSPSIVIPAPQPPVKAGN